MKPSPVPSSNHPEAAGFPHPSTPALAHVWAADRRVSAVWPHAGLSAIRANLLGRVGTLIFPFWFLYLAIVNKSKSSRFLWRQAPVESHPLFIPRVPAKCP